MSHARPLALVALAAAALAAPLPFASTARADGAPVNLSLFTPIQIVPASKSVSGLRLDLIYGRNVNVTGVDWGLVNHDTGTGFAWQAGAVNLVEKDFTGWQEGWVNMTKDTFTGFQDGLFNSSDSMNGFALGVVNVTKHMHGVQVGVFNMTETMHGLQIGVANVIQKGKIPVLPIVNWTF
ncbi:MAG TPA: hypothetical protein VGU27_06865 [Candidatus Eisenbacteria bacterium]|nr:hypothetical protein [Candidatus Eisenbacteria bacterium]